MMLFGDGYVSFAPVATGAYVRPWAGEIERLDEAIFGLREEASLYTSYTAYAIFALPVVTGPVTSEQMNIPPWDRPDVSEFRVDVKELEWEITEIGFTQSWYIPLEIEVRRSLLQEEVAGGLLDPEGIDRALATGRLIGSTTVPSPGASPAEGPSASVMLSEEFRDGVKTSQTGLVVLAFSMPFVSDPAENSVQLLHLIGEQSLVMRFDAYTITPVPEPATYAWIGAGLCAGVVVWRRRRR